MSVSAPVLDYARMAQGHLRMMVESAIRLHGLPADVYHAVQADDSDYERSLVPEDQYDEVPDDHTDILIGEAGLVGGMTLDDIISIEARLDADVIVTSLYPFVDRDRLQVRFPGDKLLHIKIISSHTVSGLFEVNFMFHARVM